ncbi:RNA-directed DNA polymerase [Gammaproteobacteria bacterium]
MHAVSRLCSMVKSALGLLPPLHLRGLNPSRNGVNHLWQAMQAEPNLDQAFVWLCEQTEESSHNSDVWNLRRDWPAQKAVLRQALWQDTFTFQPVRVVEVRNDAGQTERREVRCAIDRLVIRAIAQVLQPVFQPLLSPQCTHMKGNGGLHQAVRDTQAYIASHPESFIIKSDIKSYYASIDHLILTEQLRVLLPNEVQLHRLLWQFMRRTTEYGGNYSDIEQGLPLGASLSPLLGAVYLAPLDALGAEVKNGFYRRYMDDWVLGVPKRHQLRQVLKDQYAVLHALSVQMHPDKTFIGKVAKGFDFLGFHCCPTGLQVSDAALSRRDEKIRRLYELGADKKRIARYLAAWLGWTLLVVQEVKGQAPCGTINDGMRMRGILLHENCHLGPALIFDAGTAGSAYNFLTKTDVLSLSTPTQLPCDNVHFIQQVDTSGNTDYKIEGDTSRSLKIFTRNLEFLPTLTVKMALF